ncbi:MAG: Spy/CpxP family protein refolding chaperone [Spirochaetia bacterium]|nr:Spy/CpxP family protein refolding chaperone [Spirochaetia bacterium]
MIKKVLILTGSLIVIGGLLFSSCHRWGHHRGMSKEKIVWFQKHLASKLDLNSDQKIKLEQIANRFIDKIPEWNQRKMKISDVMTKTFESDTFDALPLNTEFDSMQKHMIEMKTMSIQALADFHAILTPEQRKKLVEIMKKHQKHYKED